MNKDSRKRRRICADHMRRDMMRRRHSNPVAKMTLNLLALISAILAMAPAMPEIISAPNASRDRRIPPDWYPNGPNAWARERGLEQEDDPEEPKQPSPALRPKATASWSRLVKDLNRRPTRDRAREIIETHVPPEALDWLRDTIQLEDWVALRMIGWNRTADEIRERSLLEAMKWQAARTPQMPMPGPKTPDDTDDITPSPGPKPK